MLLQKLRNRKGFTIMELLIVLIIIAIMVIITLPHFLEFKKKSIERSSPINIITPSEEKALDKINTPPPPVQKKEESKKEGEMQTL